MSNRPNCESCGRFMICEPGAAWAMIYSGHPPTPDREIFRCKPCVEKRGGFIPQLGIRPEASVGIFKEGGT